MSLFRKICQRILHIFPYGRTLNATCYMLVIKCMREIACLKPHNDIPFNTTYLISTGNSSVYGMQLHLLMTSIYRHRKSVVFGEI